MGTVAYRPLTQAEQIFKELIWDNMIRVGEVWIEGAVPFLALPVIRQMDEAVAQEITDAVFNQIVTLIDLTAIRFVNAEREETFRKASLKLETLAAEQGVDSDSYRKAKEDAKLALANFVHMGP